MKFRSHRLWFAAFVTAFVLFMISIAVNQYLFLLLRDSRTQINRLRLDPYELDRAVLPADPLLSSQKRVVFFGDSRAELWPAPTGLDAFQFVNRGISGQTSVQVVKRFTAQIVPLQPDMIVLQVCINDLQTIPVQIYARVDLIENCLTNIRSIIEQTKALGASVILTTVFPVSDASLERRLFFWSDDIADAVRDVNEKLRGFANEQVIIMDAYALLVGENGLIRPEYAVDTVHLSLAGYEVLNGALTAILEEEAGQGS